MRPVNPIGLALAALMAILPVQAATLWPQGEQALYAEANGERMQAWQVNTHTARLQAQNLNDLATPLGSTWKLFVYAYVVDKALPDTPYQCTGAQAEEKYCCDKGGSIGRDQALLQSCGLYFQPQRLGISAQDWRYYWYLQRAPLWLTELGNLKEDTVLPVRDVLWGLQQVPNAPKLQAEQVLLNVWLRTDNRHSLAPIGSHWRGKTLTMPHPLDKTQRIGGMAGWTGEGAAFWLLARGNSHEVLARSGAWLPKLNPATASASAVPTQPTEPLQAACVEVDYLAFMTNPIVNVKRADTQQSIYGGVLPRGDYVVTLQNGRQVKLHSVGDVSVFAQEAHYRLRARMDMNEYVARVLEREAAAVPEQAAKALSIAIRTYALNEASGSGACLLMRDSTQQQRVLTQPASAAAKRIAHSTDLLVLNGAHGRFQAEATAPNVLGWQQAVAWAQQGLGFKDILARAYPQASLGVQGKDLGERCQPMPQAQKWLQTQMPRWHKILQREAGYRPLAQAASVCQLARGTPYADVAANRVYIRRLHSEAEQLTLTHEYVHLLLQHHPNGRNERYIEALAQRLLKGQ